ncbi:hypothetical protein GCM10027598_73460 [Amycolatopsis oliviviridis]|uniref:Barstar (barnase inhibitor) domain-containing protein n=1 Tax=Amycolatopsis oliviviridis TaxID=1471590 RepID=A0ABQ3L907_9PSEU|nr:hypothetical protein [Amycolatopsis oliviviridis]GHH02376.1 hypothetical protein GCM10017790_03390 [Amycolatopsis oliviviridis]
MTGRGDDLPVLVVDGARFSDFEGFAREFSRPRPHIGTRLDNARRGEGPTLFDDIVDIIRDHGPGGTEAEDGVFLELL